MTDATKKQAAAGVQLVGRDQAHRVDVELIAGKRRILVDTSISVTNTPALDNFADVWFDIPVAGGIGDTIRVQIAVGAHDTTAPDRDIAATDKTTTVTASEAGDELALRDLVISDLNGDTNFKAGWVASAVRDNPIVHIQSIFIGEFGERETAGDFQTSVTGTTTTVDAFDKIVRRQKSNEGTRNPDDPRLVTFGISGTVFSMPAGRPPQRFFLSDGGGSRDQSIDGLTTPTTFKLTNDSAYDPARDLVVTQLRIHAVSGSIPIGKWIEVDELVNGFLVEIRSQDELTYSENLKLTEDIFQRFAFGMGAKYDLLIGAGEEALVATFERPFIIRKAGTFPTDDDVTALVRDDLSTSSIFRHEMMVVGFYLDD